MRRVGHTGSRRTLSTFVVVTSSLMPLRSLALLVVLALAACQSDAVQPVPATAAAMADTSALPLEERAQLIPLAGPLASPQAEISGLAWHGDRLILLPQYPGRFAVGADSVDLAGALNDEGALFAISKADLLAFLDGTHPEALRPEPVPFAAPGLASGVPGFEGFEAVAFRGDEVFVLIESAGTGAMQGFLATGRVAADGGVRLDAGSLEPLPPQARLDNLSYETLLATPDGVIALQEANGAAVNPTPEAYRYDAHSTLRDSLRVPTLEYRLTDATEADSAGRFWVMNFFYPGDHRLLRPGPDALAAKFGQGRTHRQRATVERLVELHVDGGRIVPTERAPLQLELLDGSVSRNWEGIARLDARGFLAATDTYPTTMLAFIAVPPEPPLTAPDTTTHETP